MWVEAESLRCRGEGVDVERGVEREEGGLGSTRVKVAQTGAG